MSARPVVRRRSMITLACAAAVAVGLAGCGRSNHPATGENDGVYVTAGPITYQLQVSRELNQYATEDKQYLVGLPARAGSLGTGQEWYMVSLWGKNQTDHPATTSSNFDIVDTQGRRYYPVPVDTSVNQYAWTARSLDPGAIEPGPDTTASFGPTQGGLLLFKMPTTIYDNRPLILEIRAPSGKVWGTISLDL